MIIQISSRNAVSGIAAPAASALPSAKPLHPVSVRRFPSFRTQPLENVKPLPMSKWVPEQPSPWRNLLSGNPVMERPGIRATE